MQDKLDRTYNKRLINKFLYIRCRWICHLPKLTAIEAQTSEWRLNRYAACYGAACENRLRVLSLKLVERCQIAFTPFF